MPPRSLQTAADECFREAVGHVRTLEAHRASIEVWNAILDQAAAAAAAAKARLIDEHRYDEAAVAIAMAKYFAVMKATEDAPFQPAR